MLLHLSLSHRASSSRNLFVCNLMIFPIANEINLLIRIAIALSNGSGRPPNSSKTLLSPSRLLMKLLFKTPRFLCSQSSFTLSSPNTHFLLCAAARCKGLDSPKATTPLLV